MRLAIISDIHEDILSLKKILSKAEKKGYDKLICLGDISGFSVPYYKYNKTRNAHACLSLIREKADIIIPGNHDLHAGGIIPDFSSVFDFPSDWYELDYRKKSEMANNTIWLHEENDLNPLYTPEDIEFLRSLPEYRVLETSTINIMFSHYIYPNLSGCKKGFYSREEDFKQHFTFMKENECSVSFTGHTHTRGMYSVSPRHFRHYRYKSVKIEDFPLCIGIHPVTSHQKRSGFCIFDTESLIVAAKR